MAMTRDEILKALLEELAEYENQSDINSARARADQWAQDNGISLNDPRYTQAFAQARGQLSIGGPATGTGTSPATTADGIVSLAPIRSAEGMDFQTLPPAPAEPRQPGAAALTAAELEAFLPYRPQSITQTPAFNVAGPAALTFFDRILNRPVPVVTRGVLPSGEPTTGITMGRADLQPSGEMDITATFPSTGANIMGSGLGGTTVGLSAEQADAAGLPPGSATGTILTTTGDQFITPGGTLPSAQVIGTTGATPTTTGTFLTGDTGNVTGVGLAPVTAPAPGTTPGVRTPEQIIQDLFLTSDTKDIAAQRIGDYAASLPRGLTAQQIADAINPVLNQQSSTFAQPITQPITQSDVLGAVQDFGYGTQGLNPGLTGPFITEQGRSPFNLIPEVLAQRPQFDTPEAQAAELQRLNTQAAAVGQGPYTETEAANRMLDFARRQGMTLGEAASAFGMNEQQAREAADRLGINLTNFNFRDGGEAMTGLSAVDRNLMNRAGIMGSVNDDMSKALLNNISTVMGRT
tara:strand:+ start:574 stop:2136 length:1563 start_codon:yes stop_codon:yes gene_type:complete